MARKKEDLIRELTLERARLVQLDRARGRTHEKLDALARELQVASSQPAPISRLLPDAVPRTPGEKISLFRSLFRGRPDLFPTRFVSRKTGKAGYAPACANKFKAGLCALQTGGKCSDCAHQAFFLSMTR
jgi:hypothetical protein